MQRFVPPKIEDVGLEKFLDSKAAQHNGLGFREFKVMVDSGVNVANLCKAFNVSRPTMERWLRIYQQKPTV